METIKTSMCRIIAIFVSLLIIASYSFASTWLQGELTYNQTIDNKQCLAKVTLLRPESYFVEKQATNSGEKLTVNLPEMGLDNVAMDIISLKSFKGIAITENGNISYKQPDEIDWTNKTNRPVTATFKRYAKEVYSYKFRSLKTNKVSTINVTPNHPFYLTNEHKYTSISAVKAADKLLSQTGEILKLQCNANQSSNCGTKYNKDNKPILVYNFEVYQQHRYFVKGKNNISVLVHNGCEKLIGSGINGSFYQISDSLWGVKKFASLVTPNNTDPLVFANNNAKGFNLYYGSRSAFIALDRVNNNPLTKSVSNRLKLISGTPLDSINNQEDIKAIWDLYKNSKVIDNLRLKLSEKGIFHRDLKMGNILYNAKTHQFNIIDFDSAEYVEWTLDSYRSEYIQKSLNYTFELFGQQHGLK